MINVDDSEKKPVKHTISNISINMSKLHKTDKLEKSRKVIGHEHIRTRFQVLRDRKHKEQ